MRAAARTSFALLAALFAFALPVTSAHAATITMPINDPAGDNTAGDASLDLVGGSIVYNSTAGQVTLTLTMGAPLPDDTQGTFFIFLRQAVAGVCPVATEGAAPSTTDLAIALGQDPTTKTLGGGWGLINGDTVGTFTVARNGNTVTITTNADKAIANANWNCADIEISEPPDADGNAPRADQSLAYASTSATPTPGPGTPTPTPTPPAQPKVTLDPDGDRDGTPDSEDRCPTVPGAATTGCPTMPKGQEIRLGAKRVVVDKLVARVAATCPSPVRVKVLSKGKAVASALATVSQFGSFCRVDGIVRLKHRYAAVRVTMEKTGVAGFKQSAHRG